ncbi:MAG: hypothetical protein KDJ65_03605 [Anaerolineae bacterium]|nr:hypothetical protein [Anaerolineae bacterium]
MSTVTLSPQLLAELEQVATEQAVNPEQLLEDAVRTYLRQLEREKIKVEAEAFRKLHPQLIKLYRDQFVAVHNGTVVDYDQDFQTLHKRVRQRFGRQAILLRRVTSEPERTLVMRSPRLERK